MFSRVQKLSNSTSPLHEPEAAYRESSESFARLLILSLLAPVVVFAIWLDQVYPCWGVFICVCVLALVAVGYLSRKLFQSFDSHFQDATQLNYTVVQNSTIDSGGKQLHQFLHGNNTKRWARNAQVANWGAILWVVAGGIIMTVATVYDIRARQVSLTELDATMVPTIGFRFEPTDPSLPDPDPSKPDPSKLDPSKPDPANPGVTPNPDDQRVIPIDPNTGSRIITDVIVTTLPGLRKLERDIKATKGAVEQANGDPNKSAEATRQLRDVAKDAGKLARDPNVSPELQKKLEDYSETANETADAMDEASKRPDSADDSKKATGKKEEHAAKADQLLKSSGEERGNMEKVEQQLTGKKGGLSQKSKDLASKAAGGDSSARSQFQRQVENDLQQSGVMVKYNPPGGAKGGAQFPSQVNGVTPPNNRSLPPGLKREGVVDGKTTKKLTQKDRGIGQDGSSVDK